MKILGGQYKNRNFYMPGWIRPTQNMTRKAVFDIIGHDLTGLTVLELFAGSGAIGLEALSRKAGHVTFVEKDRRCVSIIEDNLRLLGLKTGPEGEGSAEVIYGDVFAAIKLMSKKKLKFDVIFMDPPYGREMPKKALKTLMAYDILAPNSMLVVEYSSLDTLPELPGRFSHVDQRRYGKSYLAIYTIE